MRGVRGLRSTVLPGEGQERRTVGPGLPLGVTSASSVLQLQRPCPQVADLTFSSCSLQPSPLVQMAESQDEMEGTAGQPPGRAVRLQARV